MKQVVLIWALCFGLLTSAAASEVVLKNGQKMTGKIVEQTDKYIKFDLGQANEKLVMTFYSDEIDSIDGEKTTATGLAKPKEVIAEPVPTEIPSAETTQVVADNTAPTQEKAADTIPVVSNNIPTPEAVVNKVVQESVPAPESVQTTPPQINKPAPRTTTEAFATGFKEGFQKSTAKSKYSLAAVMGLGVGVLSIVLVFIVIIYFLLCYPIYKIALKLNTEPTWLAWVPLAQLYLVCKMGKRPYWILLVYVLSYVPVVGFVFMILSLVANVYIWMGVSQARGKAAWLGILSIIPIVGFFFIWYLALSE